MSESAVNATAAAVLASASSNEQSQADTSYCFKWSNYQNHLSEVVRQLLEEECMVDVTLYAGGERIQAHRLVLCACSTLFQEILSQNNDEHPVIILSDISPQDVRSIVEFSYNGEVRIPVDNINNLLEAAHSLKICGLMEIGGLDETEILSDKDLNAEESYILNNVMQTEDDDETYEKENNGKNKEKVQKNSSEDSDSKSRKQRKSVGKKEYSDEMLAAAIADIRAGCSLLEAASKNHIPRSTLYMRAKVLGIALNPSRSEYTIEDMKGAIQSVMAGSSLQQAADCYGIPKTVLWRRIQKEGCLPPRQDKRKNYATEKREAAVRALARGEALTKVANKYKIPKTTLFRDKARLVDQGKLPLSFWKKRKTDSEELKKSRLEEAVIACKDGKMSQAAASVLYQIPKTTIWRRLQKDITKTDSPSAPKKTPKKVQSEETRTPEIIKAEHIQEADFDTYCGDDAEMNITYIDENNISEDPVIIFASGDVDDLNLPNSRSLVVVQEAGDENFISCGLELDENSTFVSKS